MALENVTVVPGLLLAKVMASRSDPQDVQSDVLVTVNDCARAAGARAVANSRIASENWTIATKGPDHEPPERMTWRRGRRSIDGASNALHQLPTTPARAERNRKAFAAT